MSLPKILAAALLLLSAAPVLAIDEAKTDIKNAADAETEQQSRLMQAQKLIAAGNHAEAIALIDKTIAYYEARFPEGETRWYIGRTVEETLIYMSMAAVSGDQADSKISAQAINVAWADAYFLKGYAYIELNQAAEAKVMLLKALKLSPQNASFLIELAEVAKLQRNWDESYKYYVEAESASAFSPSDAKASDLSHAKRGQAFVFIEQGKLDEAEKVLKACLKLDKNDQRAKEELEYIKKLRK
ncbi:MAG: tetratricopeptide repeat protein [Arenimonas sp.]